MELQRGETINVGVNLYCLETIGILLLGSVGDCVLSGCALLATALRGAPHIGKETKHTR